MSKQKSPQHLRLWRLSWPAIWSCTFFPPLHRSTLQYHLSVPVKAGQELPCRMQAAHPQCGTSPGISTHMLTLPFPTASTDVVRGKNLYCVFTVTSAPGSVKHTVIHRCWWLPSWADQVVGKAGLGWDLLNCANPQQLWNNPFSYPQKMQLLIS